MERLYHTLVRYGYCPKDEDLLALWAEVEFRSLSELSQNHMSLFHFRNYHETFEIGSIQRILALAPGAIGVNFRT